MTHRPFCGRVVRFFFVQSHGIGIDIHLEHHQLLRAVVQAFVQIGPGGKFRRLDGTCSQRHKARLRIAVNRPVSVGPIDPSLRNNRFRPGICRSMVQYHAVSISVLSRSLSLPGRNAQALCSKSCFEPFSRLAGGLNSFPAVLSIQRYPTLPFHFNRFCVKML